MSTSTISLPCERPAHGGVPRSGQEPAADDLPALRLVKVPDWPPFDGDPAAGQADADRAHPSARIKTEGGGVLRAAGTAGRLEASSEWAGQFARMLTEALAGARPIRQILPLTSERARVHIRRLTPMFDCGHRPHILRVIATRPTREVIEMTVVVAVGTRTRALAVRLEQPATAPRQLARPGAPGQGPWGTWVCTDIEAA
jgi:uncharacterized protein DUF6459